MVDTKGTKYIHDDSLTNHEMESYYEMMKESLVEFDSQGKAHNEINGRNKCEFEDRKEEHQELQNDIFKTIIRPSEEFSFDKTQHGLGYD